ncbi:MAG: cell envelope integrity protein TolA [Clostridia bacterium]|nr:cell envelope integrity protein TolA [Clostridia bacterium]
MKNKKRYWYVTNEGKRKYVSTKKELPYRERKKRSKQKKISAKEAYTKKVLAARKRSESLKKFWESEEGKRKKKLLSDRQKRRARAKKKVEQTHKPKGAEDLGFTKAVATVSSNIERVKELLDSLPDTSYAGYNDKFAIRDRVDEIFREMETAIETAEYVDPNTGEIFEGEQAYNIYLDPHMPQIEKLYMDIWYFISRPTVVYRNLFEILNIIKGFNNISKEQNIRFTETQRRGDIDTEELSDREYDEDRSYLNKIGW